MPLSEVTISYDLSDLTGATLNGRRTKVWATTNVPGDTVIDTDGNQIRLGTGTGVHPDEGPVVGTIAVWAPGTGSNPASWQTYIHVDYPDRHKTGGRGKRTFGPFAITASANLADLVAEQEVPAEYVTTLTAELDTYATAAATSADEAATSAALAKSVADIDTSDSLVATLVEDSGSATGAALSATYGGRLGLGSLGLNNATTDITPVLNAAVAAGRLHVLIPKRATPWPMLTQFTYNGADRLTIEFEPGARVSTNMGTTAAMDLTRTTLVNASLTSPFVGPITTSNWGDYAFPAREVMLRDDCRTEGNYYQEYGATGIHVIGKRVRFMGDLKFHGMRHRTGWAAGLHIDGGLGGVYDIVCHGSVTCTDSDRAIEVEEGAYDVTFVGGGRFTNIYPNGYTGQPTSAAGPDGSAYANYTFTLGGHSHAGAGAVRNLHHLGEWVLENCGGGVVFDSDSTPDADKPRDNYVESVTIKGLALAPGYQAISLGGFNNRVERVRFETGSGIAGSLMRVRGYGGARNSVGKIDSDTATKNFIRVDNDGGGGLTVGDLPMPALKSSAGKYISPTGTVNGTSNALGNNTLRLIPFYIGAPMCIDRIGCEVTVAGQAGSVVRLGIYDDAGGLPGNPVVDKTVPADAVGLPEASNFTVLLPGWYWIGGAVQGAATTQPTLRSAASSMAPDYPMLADTASWAISATAVSHYKTGVSGALPAFGTVPQSASNAVRVFLRLAA